MHSLALIRFNSIAALLLFTIVLSYGATTINIENLDFNISKVNRSDSLYFPSPYVLENYCHKKDTTIPLIIDPWKAAIFELGFLKTHDGLMASKSIHKCKVSVTTEKGFGLAAFIEYLNIRGKQDVYNMPKWICKDYILFSAPGKHILGQLFSYLDINFMNEKDSEKFCGQRDIFDVQNDRVSHTNSFNTESNLMNILFHQDVEDNVIANNSFRVTVTTFKIGRRDKEACKDKQMCLANSNFCIHENFACDGHINCAFNDHGNDEKQCNDVDKLGNSNAAQQGIKLSVTEKIICWILILGVCLIVMTFALVIFCRWKSYVKVQRVRAATMHVAASPRHELVCYRESNLPGYETVILSDQEALKAIELEELPPKYDSLFPEGPPKQIEMDSTK